MYIQRFIQVHCAPLERHYLGLESYKHDAPPEQRHVSQDMSLPLKRLPRFGLECANPKL